MAEPPPAASPRPPRDATSSPREAAEENAELNRSRPGAAERGAAVSFDGDNVANANKTYIMCVADRLMQSTQKKDDEKRNSVVQWCMDQGKDNDMKEHIASVIRANGISDSRGRLKQVDAAVKRQQQLLLDRKNRKKTRLQGAVGRSKSFGAMAAEAEKEGEQAQEPEKKETDEVAPDIELRWLEVKNFKTRMEAVGFIMECQPFDYQPVLYDGEQFPKFEDTRDAVAYVCQLTPVPNLYVSTATEFKRRMRVRLVYTEDSKETARTAQIVGRRNSAAASAPAEPQRPWLVEASGIFFERPESLRALVDNGKKYFLAVPPEVERKVLQDGYKASRRFSIPCSATPQDAIDAFRMNEVRDGRRTNAKAVVLAVNVPPDVDVVAHRSAGFVIRARELPCTCFSRRKAGMADVKKAPPDGGTSVALATTEVSGAS